MVDGVSICFLCLRLDVSIVNDMFVVVKSGNDVEVVWVIVEGCYGGGGSCVWVLVF